LFGALTAALMVLGGLSLRQYQLIMDLRQPRRSAETRDAEGVRDLTPSLVNIAHPVREPAKVRADAGNTEEMAQLAELSEQLRLTQEQLGALSLRYGWEEQIAERLSGAVCLIQGEYLFVDPKTGKPLRYTNPDGTTGGLFGHDPFGASGTDKADWQVSVKGAGPELRIQYTGTGFLIDRQGYIVTNKHVTRPWEMAPEYRHIIAAGYVARRCIFRAFFPNHIEPIELEVVGNSDREDVALLYGQPTQDDITPLVCESDPNRLRVGQTVVVLGYPTGFDVLLARMSRTELTDVLSECGSSFDLMARNLARRGLIQPVATRGMCGRVSQGRIVYDAPTAIGGSGAPVVDSDGNVVAINTALLKGFTGTNFGVPIQEALDLWARVRQQTVDLTWVDLDEPAQKPAR
jgi:serine protease Do